MEAIFKRRKISLVLCSMLYDIPLFPIHYISTQYKHLLYILFNQFQIAYKFMCILFSRYQWLCINEQRASSYNGKTGNIICLLFLLFFFPLKVVNL